MANRAEITTNSIVGVNYIIMNEALNALWTSIKKKEEASMQIKLLSGLLIKVSLIWVSLAAIVS